MKQKRNREKIMEQSLYDLLCSMNDCLQKNGAVVTPTYPDGKEEDSCRACIMDCIMNAVSAKMRCKGSCEKCIADYLNEYPF